MGSDSPNSKDSEHSDTEQQSQQLALTSAVDKKSVKDDNGDSSQRGSLPYSVIARKKISSGSLLPEKVFSPKKFIGDGDRYTHIFVI